ncbi:MAG TPA: helix-turn-helix domain-containing protein [Pseudonocardiaceae bacterium]|jgi:transposase-like protein|nr:helix-turn-helix domain-containing protein [Pseudonocardiaceae bacterium]
MTQALEPNGVAEPPSAIPRQLAALLRPELDSLAEEIIAEIRRTIPEYARPIDGPYGQAQRVGVGMAITAFVDQLADPSRPREHRDDVCRKLGQNEEREGRSLDTLQAAYRVGGRIAWQRIMKVGRRSNLSSTTMSQLADTLFGYLDDLASLSLAGYTEERTRSAEAVEEWRRRLLHLILECAGVPDSAFDELAGLARWPLPAEVTLVAVTAGATVLRPLLDEDILLDLRGAEPYLLVPGQVTAARQRGLQTALPGEQLTIGVTVPLRQALDSLRWARQALNLAVFGVFGAGKIVRCEDHLPTVWLLSDTALIDQVGKRQLAALAGLTSKQRARLLETLAAWLRTRGSAAEIAEQLSVHPQTVRYRMRQLEKAFGARLDDPDERFALELVLRASRLRELAQRREEAGAVVEITAHPAAS